MGTPGKLDRYLRQMTFPDIGEDGQCRLLSSAVAIIGSGGLGTHIADNLVRAGVGRLKLVDRDYVELSNLQRQMLFDEQDVAGRLPKAEAAARKLGRINSQVQIEPLVLEVSPRNVEGIVSDVDLVLDACDNFDTRYLVNEACVKHDVPWVYGGAVASYGMTMTIVPHRTPCLRCVFPERPPSDSLPTCATAGILASIVAIIASLECSEALKLLTGRGKLNEGLIHVDVWENSFEAFSIERQDERCPVCGRAEYELLGSA
ncbi:MAG TPA: ThiF family adenylyltransferase [Anaerolineae bacterium]|nr:ThiF family adenylyltransferase [Anaerolineae bacterium]